MRKVNLIVSMVLLSASTAFAAHTADAQPTDTTKVVKDTNNGAVSKDEVALLNASSASEPRAVPIGLPAAYTVVRQDGLPVTYFWDPNATKIHWRQDGSLARTKTLPMSMTAILEGEIGVGVDSYTRFGSNKPGGHAQYQLNTLGKHDFNIGVNGKIVKDWYFSLNAYNVYDPGNVKLQYTPFADRAQMYTATIKNIYDTKGSNFAFLYKYSELRDLTTTVQQAPYYWVGDGSVRAIDDFTIGKSNYGSNDGVVEYIDVRTGEAKRSTYQDEAHTYSHEGKFMLDHYFDKNTRLDIRAKYSYTDRGSVADNTQNVLKEQTRQYADRPGEYTGHVQRRLIQLGKGTISDYMLTATMNFIRNNHDFKVGVFDYHERAKYSTSSVQYDHTVEANPVRLLFNGNAFFNKNNGSQYVDGWENKLGAYAFDTWKITPNIKVGYGARLEWFKLDADYIESKRYNGFYLGGPTADGKGVVTTSKGKLNGLNYSFSLIPTVNFTKDFGFDGELNFISMYRHLQGFYSDSGPLANVRPHTLGRAGLFYNHKYFSVVSSFTYSFRKGDSGRIAVVGDDGLSVQVPYKQAIQTIGWKTDLLLTPVKWFNLNVIFTLQDPKLHTYEFTAFDKQYDFSGKQMTGLSKVLLDINPRFNFGKFSIWASARYQSKQYANVGNCIFFNGRWETFAGASWKATKNIIFTANVVNVLNEKGPNGNVPGSALMTDPTQYYNTLIAGTYIRPFQTQFGVKVNF